MIETKNQTFSASSRPCVAKRLLLTACCLLLSILPCSCSSPPAEANMNESDVDAALQRKASDALGDREGTIIVMDPQTGRLRAIANPRLAFEQAFPPGSAIKPFTALAALRAGLLDSESRVLCRERYLQGDFEIVCSHPRSKSPFNLAQALAYSCNFYFAELGQRLSAGSFTATLASFGFGERTGVNTGESAGKLPRDQWHVNMALGEGDQLLVTPLQLLTAYAALVNGGHLHQPQRAAPEDFTAQELANINITLQHRAMLIEGMRGATKYGTAARAELDQVPFYIFGKTGTSTASNGFRTQGWFIGFAADCSPAGGPPPDRVHLAVLVFLKRAHGAQCAELARPIFEEYARIERRSENVSLPASPRLRVSASRALSPQIRVHLVRENVTKTVSLKEYILGVLAAESSIEGEIEALKAQAVVSRTFALKNRWRHRDEGYDFCSTTHCQRYAFIRDARGHTRFSAPSVRAVEDTEGQVLRDDQGQLIDAYFHAACGGITADIETLWGIAAPSYLRGVRDDYCATMPHRNWVQSIPAARLAAALRSDERTDVGARLNNIVIVKRDATRRAETIALEGERRRLVRGWDFKLIVGRALGWNMIKSSRFEVRRAGANFVFRGSGFGHGLGLCQEGAHVMARRGAPYRQILSHYFPGTSVAAVRRLAAVAPDIEYSKVAYAPSASSGAVESTKFSLRSSTRLSLSSEHFRAIYPARVERSAVEGALRTLELARADMLRRLAAASLNFSEPAAIDVIIHETTQAFVAATDQPWWVAAVTRGRRIELQPLNTLRRRGVLTTTLRHEYAHAVIESLGRGRTPRWLAEGLAAHFAGEGAGLARFEGKIKLSLEEIEQRLARPASAQEMRALYAAAYHKVREGIRAEGEASLWQRVMRS